MSGPHLEAAHPTERLSSATYLTAYFLVLLALVEYWVFSPSFDEFFQGDAQFWLYHRFDGFGDFLQSFYQADDANWYRPLSNRTIPALFFPWFGLDPYGYHWVIFLLFVVTTTAVFFFLKQLTSDRLVAAFGTFFFSIHANNVYVTYDFAYAPELFYTLFYLAAFILYLRWFVSRQSIWYALSLLTFVFALMSKEAAVTLPVNLVLINYLLLVPGRASYARWSPTEALKPVVPFGAILAAYLAFALLYLRVGAGGYVLAFHSEMVPRLLDSLAWTFNFAGGWSDPWRSLLPVTTSALMLFALGVSAYTLCGFGFGKRSLVLVGGTWFLVGLLPTLGIVRGFASYYLFLPTVGVALIVGLALSSGYRYLSARNVPVAVLLTILPLLVTAIAVKTHVYDDIRGNVSLGFAGRIAEQTVQMLTERYPTIEANSTIYFLNSDLPDLWRYHGLGTLFKLVYEDDSVNVLYQSLGHTVAVEELEPSRLIVIEYVEGGLADVTEQFRSNPRRYTAAVAEEAFEYVQSSQPQLEVTPTEIRAGTGSYTITIAEAPGPDVQIQYRLNGGPIAILDVRLSPAGETTFFVSSETKKGLYEFVAFRPRGSDFWIRANASIRVD